MKTTLKPCQLKILILVLGAVGFALRKALYATGIDEKGLLDPGHWAYAGLWILTVLTAGLILLLTRGIAASGRYEVCFPASPAGAAGCIAAAAAFAVSAFQDWGYGLNALDAAVFALGIAAAAAMTALAVCRLRGKTPSVLLHGTICLYLALRMIHQYRCWSSDPQLMDYCFYMAAFVALMLSSYQFAAWDAGIGNCRSLWLLGLSAIYLCCLSLIGPQGELYMGLCGLWILLNLPRYPAAREEG